LHTGDLSSVSILRILVDLCGVARVVPIVLGGPIALNDTISFAWNPYTRLEMLRYAAAVISPSVLANFSLLYLLEGHLGEIPALVVATAVAVF